MNICVCLCLWMRVLGGGGYVWACVLIARVWPPLYPPCFCRKTPSLTLPPSLSLRAPRVVLPDRAMCLRTFCHSLLTVNKSSSSSSRSLSLTHTRRPPTLDPGIDRLDPGKAIEPIKYSLHSLCRVLTPYNTVLHPSLRLPQEGCFGAPGPHLRAPGIK